MPTHLSIPKDTRALIPSGWISIEQLLDTSLPKLAPDKGVDHVLHWWRKDNPNPTTVQKVLAHPIPSKDIVNILNANLEVAISRGIKGWFDRRNPSSGVLELWVIPFWRKIRPVVADRILWAEAEVHLKALLADNHCAFLDYVDWALDTFLWLSYDGPLIIEKDSFRSSTLTAFVSKTAWFNSEHLDMMLALVRKGSLSTTTDIADTTFARSIEDVRYHSLRYLTDIVTRVEDGTLEHLYFPVNIGNKHWTAFHIDFVTRTFESGDSKEEALGSPMDFVRCLGTWLDKSFETGTRFLNRGNTLPHRTQEDNCNCGLYTINAIEHATSNAALVAFTLDSGYKRRLEWFRSLSQYVIIPDEDSPSSSDSEGIEWVGPTSAIKATGNIRPVTSNDGDIHTNVSTVYSLSSDSEVELVEPHADSLPKPSDAISLTDTESDEFSSRLSRDEVEVVELVEVHPGTFLSADPLPRSSGPIRVEGDHSLRLSKDGEAEVEVVELDEVQPGTASSKLSEDGQDDDLSPGLDHEREPSRRSTLSRAAGTAKAVPRTISETGLYNPWPHTLFYRNPGANASEAWKTVLDHVLYGQIERGAFLYNDRGHRMSEMYHADDFANTAPTDLDPFSPLPNGLCRQSLEGLEKLVAYVSYRMLMALRGYFADQDSSSPSLTLWWIIHLQSEVVNARIAVGLLRAYGSSTLVPVLLKHTTLLFSQVRHDTDSSLPQDPLYWEWLLYGSPSKSIIEFTSGTWSTGRFAQREWWNIPKSERVVDWRVGVVDMWCFDFLLQSDTHGRPSPKVQNHNPTWKRYSSDESPEALSMSIFHTMMQYPTVLESIPTVLNMGHATLSQVESFLAGA